MDLYRGNGRGLNDYAQDMLIPCAYFGDMLKIFGYLDMRDYEWMKQEKIK